MRDPFYMNRAAEIAANIVAAQAQDLGMDQIQTFPGGEVSAVLRGVTFVFAWDVTSQSIVLVSRYAPNETRVVELAA
jgi:hypothetical protein